MKNHTHIINNICGLDEVGRGSFAGPLFAACVLITPEMEMKLRTSGVVIKDSKQLSKRQRKTVFDAVKTCGIRYAVKKILVPTINTKGIQYANITVFKKLLKVFDADKYILDGNLRIFNKTRKKIVCIPKADEQIFAVTIAGIMAKVSRDTYMEKLHCHYPFYGWDRNVGYGTLEHIKAIIKHGATIHHRTSFIETALTEKRI